MSEENNIGSMDTVVIEKSKLLEILEDNKKKHDSIFEVSCLGYWDLATKRVEEKKKELISVIAKINLESVANEIRLNQKIESRVKLNDENYFVHFDFSHHLNLAYPENHSDDYNRAIRKVSLNVYDKVKLNQNEFESLVLNNWTWKNNFISTSSFYVLNAPKYSNVTGCYSAGVMISGCSIF